MGLALQPSSPTRKALLAEASVAYHEQLLEDQSAKEYLERRSLLDSVEQNRLGVVRFPRAGHERYEGMLAIPYIGPAGNVYDIRYRCIQEHNCKEEGHGKYEGEPGVTTRLYNTRALVAPTDYILLCEGELDAATLGACGWPAVGVPGASHWKPHHSRCFDGFRDVVVLADGDDAGRKLASAIVKSLADARSVLLPEGEDVNSIYVSGGKAALAALLKGEVEG